MATVRRPDGARRDILLGRYNSPESKAEYERLLATLRASPAAIAVVTRGKPSAGVAGTADPTVNELLLAFLGHAAGYYRRPDGTPTSELKNYRDAVRPVKTLFGHVPAGEFGPLALKAVRQRLVDDGYCRPVVNKMVGRVKRVFKWAAGEELIPFDVLHRLAAVAGQGKGQAEAREPEPIRPVVPAYLAGMRPGEVCRLAAGNIDRTGPVWTYTPPQHKTAHRGKSRRVKLGGPAQAVLASFRATVTDPAAPLFSPRQAQKVRYTAMRAARKSRVTPSQRCRKRNHPDPRKTLAEAYTAHSYS